MNEDLLSELAEQFRTHTLERLDTMRTLLARLEADRDNREILTAIHRHFHGLAGLGGTYGFPLISELGADAEETCESIGPAGVPDDAFVAMLGQTIERIAEETGKGRV